MTLQKGPCLDYLGIKTEKNSDGSLNLFMPRLITKIISNTDTLAATPAKSNTFGTDGNNTPLSREQAAIFYLIVRKLMYLTMWVRPDLAPAVPMLLQYVTCPTISHLRKLNRIQSLCSNCRHGFPFFSRS